MPDLLIELFSEEIPARMQGKAAEELRRLMTDGLVEAGLTYAGAAAFATPRRLVLSLEGLTDESRPQREERKGPAVTAPQPAIDGFLRSTGLTLDQLEKRAEKKGEVYFAVTTRPGRKAAEIVAEVLEGVIRNFPWPKSMRWGAGNLRWVRPLHSILCLLSDENGSEVVPLTVDGITADRVTRGHRFMAPDEISVTSFEDYEAKLLQAKVLLRLDARADQIRHEAETLAFAAGLELVAEPGLLAEVAGLVEWPVVLMGEIREDFLHLPPEVLQTSMKEHQKFFSLRNPANARIERFITVANIETKDQGAMILAGNGKVLAARLSDALFFYDNDLRVAKAGMGEWIDGLSRVTFHGRLGSQADRVGRIAALAREIAPMVGADADLAERAAGIAKADLRSEMVGEFPELQGLMGRYYAIASGEDPAVAAACEEHYSPLGPNDAVPTAPVSVAVALADKIDTLTGFWAIDEKPTGSKDPFALRRAALGVIRLVLGNGVRLALSRLIDKHQQYIDAETGIVWIRDTAEKPDGVPILERSKLELLSFLHDRLKVHLREDGIRHDVIDAILAMPGNDDLTLVVKRARALADFLQTEDGENLVQGFKRANNILTQAEEKDGVEYSFGADPKFAEADEEKALFTALDTARAAIAPAMQAEDFGAAMAEMARLRAPIDVFFTAVQINSDNPVLRRNRLNLLARIREICLSVADLTRIEG